VSRGYDVRLTDQGGGVGVAVHSDPVDDHGGQVDLEDVTVAPLGGAGDAVTDDLVDTRLTTPGSACRAARARRGWKWTPFDAAAAVVGAGGVDCGDHGGWIWSLGQPFSCIVIFTVGSGLSVEITVHGAGR